MRKRCHKEERAGDLEEGWKRTLYLLETHAVVLIDEVGSLEFPKRLGVLGKKDGKRDRMKKLGNRAEVLFDKQGNGAENVRAGSYFVKHLATSFRNSIEVTGFVRLSELEGLRVLFVYFASLFYR